MATPFLLLNCFRRNRAFVCICVHDENLCPEVDKRGQLKIEPSKRTVQSWTQSPHLDTPQFCGVPDDEDKLRTQIEYAGQKREVTLT